MKTIYYITIGTLQGEVTTFLQPFTTQFKARKAAEKMITGKPLLRYSITNNKNI